MSIQEQISKYYDLFKGLPSNKPIVRENQTNDAFEILVYDLLFRENKYGEPLRKENLEELEKCIVPAPDDSIDIFYEEEKGGDDYKYHVVQVKNTDIAEVEIKTCFAQMKRSIETFHNKRKDVKENLKRIISETNFDTDNCDCVYYVVHTGKTDNIRGQRKDEKIITIDELETIQKSIIKFCVPEEKIQIDIRNNYINYKNEPYSDEESDTRYEAYQVNLNAFDLAKLCRKYINSEIGRNILFGQNLRESLSNKSKTFSGMFITLDNEPENFWFYNNGITIIAEKVDLIQVNKEDFLHLNNFSIINGAQTTSTLGEYLRAAEQDGDRNRKDKLRKAFVTARIVETKENDSLREKITIFNNTQNPISSRDMVSNNREQKELQKRFMENELPHIFIQIRRGESKPKSKYFQKHQLISNDELAQFVFAGFLSKPFTAKDKKNSLFNKDNSNDYEINKEYDEVFKISDDYAKYGELFKRNHHDLNELLFIKMIHGKAKKYLKDYFQETIERNKRIIESESSNDVEKERASKVVEITSKSKQINNVNTFYNITSYYEFKKQFDELLNTKDKRYDFDRFYSKDKNYEKQLVEEFAKLFTQITNEIIKELGYADPPKFTRSKSSESLFIDRLIGKIAIDPTFQNKYAEFVDKFKI